VFWTHTATAGSYSVCVVPFRLDAPSVRATVRVFEDDVLRRTFTRTLRSSAAVTTCSRNSPYFVGSYVVSATSARNTDRSTSQRRRDGGAEFRFEQSTFYRPQAPESNCHCRVRTPKTRPHAMSVMLTITALALVRRRRRNSDPHIETALCERCVAQCDPRGASRTSREHDKIIELRRSQRSRARTDLSG
jgi:hypothetical protein